MGFLGTLLKTTIHVVTTPIDIISDVVTLGGTLTDKEESAIERKARKIRRDMRDLEDDVDSL
jgi:hypothetical protein